MAKEFREALTLPYVRKAETIRRLVKVYGVPGLVEVTLSSDGLAFRVPGSRKYVTSTWLKVVEHAAPDGNVPCFLANDPVKMLTHEEAKVGKRRAKREQDASADKEWRDSEAHGVQE
jgi:hypothetical protein